MKKWIFSGGILNKVAEEEPDIETLQKDLAIDDLSLSETEAVAANQLQMAQPVTPDSMNNSFVATSTGLEQQTDAYQMQPYHTGMQSTSKSTSNICAEYNSKQVTPGASKEQKPNFIQGVVQNAKNYLHWK